ncbi:MAG TPA: SAM-dependent methyltransferase [Vicinamibacterales bacterium]|nr:SAM-dependent methyltransferase [Vicinamibacterales bacterium]
MRSTRTRRGARSTGAGVRRGSLTIVGTGIRLVGQTTLEALAAMQRADKLFYLVADRATETWIRRLNASATTLEDCYDEGKRRSVSYREMADLIVGAVRSGLDVCVAYYGHPGVFVTSAHAAIRRARRAGFPARMLPGVSAEDCLYADLAVDPAPNGSQNFEATDFLAARRRFDPTSALILWQVGVLGEPSVRRNMSCRPDRLRVLTAHLRRFYPARHRVVLYKAAQLPIMQPVIKAVALQRLPREAVGPLMTLYVPPLPSERFDAKILRWYSEPEPITSRAGAVP